MYVFNPIFSENIIVLQVLNISNEHADEIGVHLKNPDISTDMSVNLMSAYSCLCQVLVSLVGGGPCPPPLVHLMLMS